MKGRFQNCSSLESLNVNSFNTIIVEIIGFMLKGCFVAKPFYLSSFNIINVINIYEIFSAWSNLKKFKCKDDKILKQKDLKILSLKWIIKIYSYINEK